MKMKKVLIPAMFGILAIYTFMLAENVFGEWMAFHPPQETNNASNKVTWVTITGGKFMMGTDDNQVLNAQPAHKVQIKTFKISKTPITVAQYAKCVTAKKCSPPVRLPKNTCTWGMPGRETDALNCVSWEQSTQYAKFMGARLPTEAEWEYAARSGGKNRKYTWGNQPPTSKMLRVIGFNPELSLKVCGLPFTNTEQGLCDMTALLYEWVQDRWHDSYDGAPADGSAFVTGGKERVVRGSGNGHLTWDGRPATRVESRRIYEYVGQCVGFRIVKH